MKKCEGCGAILQTENPNKEGYAKSESHLLCDRCFRIRNYSDYKHVVKDNSYYTSILSKIASTNDLILLVVDLFQIYDLASLKPFLNKNTILVLTKRDLLPKKIYEEKMLSYFNQYGIDFLDKVIVSSKDNYGLDTLYQKILNYKKSSKVYIIGYTNAGKSTLINKLITLYTDKKQQVTTSYLPSTTLNEMEIVLNDDLVLVDTPGLLINGSLLDVIDNVVFKKVVPQKRIKPVVYQVKSKQYFKVEDFLYLEVDNTDLVFYLSNSLNIERFYKDKCPNDLVKYTVSLKGYQDIVINGLGFIKVISPTTITLYLKKGVSYTVRDSFI